jgi:hypothetical protein
MRTIALLAALLCESSILGAQQPTIPDSAMRKMQEANQMMVPMMQQMAIVMMDGTLAALAKPENAQRLAQFTKNYYDELVIAGFTKEAALQIVISVGIPHAMTPGR